jgi:hypothetical protein
MRPSWIVRHFSAIVALVAVMLIFILEIVIVFILVSRILILHGMCRLILPLCNTFLPLVRVAEPSHSGTRSRYNEGNSSLCLIIIGKCTLL